MRRSFLFVLVILFLLDSAAVFGQNSQTSKRQHSANPTAPPMPDDDMQNMPGMQHSSMHEQPMTFIDEILHRSTAGKPDFLTPIYGQHPLGVILFLRVRPKGNAHSH
jgi:hypothetical protein